MSKTKRRKNLKGKLIGCLCLAVIAAGMTTVPVIPCISGMGVINASAETADAVAVDLSKIVDYKDDSANCPTGVTAVYANSNNTIELTLDSGSYKFSGKNFINESYVDVKIIVPSGKNVQIEFDNAAIINDYGKYADTNIPYYSPYSVNYLGDQCRIYDYAVPFKVEGTLTVSGSLSVDTYSYYDTCWEGNKHGASADLYEGSGSFNNGNFLTIKYVDEDDIVIDRKYYLNGDESKADTGYSCLTDPDADNVITARKDHTLSYHDAVAHTCTTDGNVEYWECSVCGKNFSDDNGTTQTTNIVDPAKHKLTHHDAVAHTCTTDGNVEYWDCSVCRKNFSDDNGTKEIDDIVDPAPGHNWDTAYAGNETHHWHNCTNANCPITEDDQKDGYAVHTPGAAATETTPQTCTECGYVLAPALGHIHANHLTFVAEVPASCTTDGVKAHYECDCGKLFSDADDTVYVTAEELKIAAHHTYGTDWESDNDENHYHVCSVCSGKADVTPHSYDSGMITTPATETTEGVKTYTCSVCNHTKTETVPKLSHTHSLSEDYSKDETGHWHTCSGCDEKVDFGAHIENSGTVTVQPTETSTGVMTYYCSVCGYEMRTEEIPAIIPEHTHSYGTEWKSDSVSHWHECSCGDKTDIAQHISNGGTVTVQPTAYSTGLRAYSCTVCGYVIRTESIPATGSNYYPTYPTYPTNPTYPLISTPSVFTEKLTAKAESDGSTATLGWDKVENADKYYVYQYKDGKYVKIRTTTDTSVMLKGLKNGETYKFLVRYSIGGKLSPMTYSYKKTVKVYYKPIVKATSTENSIKLTWQAVPNAEKYAIYRYVDGKAVKLAETTKLSVIIKGLKPDTECKYIVSAYVDGEWTSMKKSDIVTIKTKAE